MKKHIHFTLTLSRFSFFLTRVMDYQEVLHVVGDGREWGSLHPPPPRGVGAQALPGVALGRRRREVGESLKTQRLKIRVEHLLWRSGDVDEEETVWGFGRLLVEADRLRHGEKRVPLGRGTGRGPAARNPGKKRKNGLSELGHSRCRI